MAAKFVKYFQTLFTPEGVSDEAEVISSIKGRETDCMNKKALFGMDPFKALGANGMTAGFYQQY